MERSFDCCGVKNIDKNNPLEKNNIMPVASATKTMSSVLLLRLVDKGLVEIYKPISTYLKKDNKIWPSSGMPTWANKITLHNLLTHTSGLAEYFMNVDLDISKNHNDINKDIIRYVSSKKPKFQPGQKYQYINSNFVFIGLIIEQVSGKKFSDFIKEEIFDPLNMGDTRVISLDEAREIQNEKSYLPNERFASRYFVMPNDSKEPVFVDPTLVYKMVPFADGGVISTAKDISKWLYALHHGKLLSQNSYNKMITPYLKIKTRDNNLSNDTYSGYGIYISKMENGDTVYHHAGRAMALRSESGYVKDSNMIYVVLSNAMEHFPPYLSMYFDKSKDINKLNIVYFVKNILNNYRK
ncbi:MAG TPA: serine hydrolase domain-containing protein [Candidatus Megaira endosymbiont of Hartmannula sinica]|nr:serine hydrolase domain-containing protein [Candidatus Megaera endosymbiont of Hartmannula sinica]